MEKLTDLWKSPRGTVIRIQLLALVAITLSFFLVIFGSSRRWSKCWIIQKGVVVAGASSLSLGTYSIALMQSSSVKSEMYPVWAATLLTLFGSIDSVTGNNLGSHSEFLKFLYQIILYCGYVLLIGISTLSSDIANIAIGVLCAVTFIKGFHKSLAYVLLSRLRNVNRLIADRMAQREGEFDPTVESSHYYVVDWPLDKAKSDGSKSTMGQECADDDVITMGKIESSDWCRSVLGSNYFSNKDICLSLSLCHLLQRRIFGFHCYDSMELSHDFVFRYLLGHGFAEDSQRLRAFNVIEVELAFLFDFVFTNNAFLRYYESKSTTVWTFASLASIIFVGVTTAIPGTRTTRVSGGTVVVNTTTYDFIITLAMLVSLALVQVLQLIRCWTSNWARVSLVCQLVRNGSGDGRRGFQMRLKSFLCRINWLEDYYLWQRKLGQYSLVESISKRESSVCKVVKLKFTCTVCVPVLRMFGSDYIQQLLQEMLGSNTGTGKTVELPVEVKRAVLHALQRSKGKLTNGRDSLRYNRAEHLLRACDQHDMYTRANWSRRKANDIDSFLTWHVATSYCEMAALKSDTMQESKSNFDVATKLSKYCVYLVVSAPWLLPWTPNDTRRVFNALAEEARKFLQSEQDKYEAMKRLPESNETIFRKGVKLGKQLEEIGEEHRWKILADFWAEMTLYVAPSDNVKEHVEQLAQGGEFITYLWALLFHAGIFDREEEEEDEEEVEVEEEEVERRMRRRRRRRMRRRQEEERRRQEEERWQEARRREEARRRQEQAREQARRRPQEEAWRRFLEEAWRRGGSRTRTQEEEEERWRRRYIGEGGGGGEEDEDEEAGGEEAAGVSRLGIKFYGDGPPDRSI